MDMQSYFNAVSSEIKTEAKLKAEANGAMSGYKIISELCNFDKNQKVIIRLFDNENDTYQYVESNFNCTSWRGSYDLPAISYEPEDIAKIPEQSYDSELDYEYTTFEKFPELYKEYDLNYSKGKYIVNTPESRLHFIA